MSARVTFFIGISVQGLQNV